MLNAVERKRPSTNPRFRWPRYWLPREHEEQAWGGPFLYNPEAEYGHIFSEHAKRLDELVDKPMLVLLGEPGSGKSTAARQERGAPDGLKAAREVLDLKEFDTATELTDALRDASARIVGAELILDGADESPVRTLGATIGRWLTTDCPSDARVRIVMRTSTLTPDLEEHLASAAQERGAKLETWVLAPLREEDVHEAARTLGFDAEAFQSEIHRVGAAHFAVLAGRLAGMAGAFARNGKLAGTLWEMYEEEVRALVDSERATVGPAYRHSRLSLNDAVRLLSRIAAVSVLSGKTYLWVDRDQDAPADALRIGDLVDPSEQELWGDGTVAFEPQIAQTLMIGPFRPSVSAGKIVWAQRPIAEFLAAKYLLDRETPLEQIRQLLIDTTTGRIPPQLHGLAAMLCSKRGTSRPFVDLFSKQDPHVALRGDLLNLPEGDCQCVAERLVGLAIGGQLTYSEFHARGLFYRLANPYLADALRPTILDRSADEFSRELAIEIAEECEVETLADDLARVALRDDALRVRIAAAYALSKSQKPEDRLRLLPALEREDDGDPDHDVRGCALRALWPNLIPLSPLLSSLVTPTQSLNYGYYTGFIGDLIDTVQDADVPELLQWAQGLPADRLHRTLSEFVDKLLQRAFHLAEDAGVREHLVPLMLRFAERTNANAGWTWLKDNHLSLEARFSLASALQAEGRQDDWIVSSITMGERGLLKSDDFVSLLDLAIRKEETRAEALRFAHGVGRLYFFSGNPDHVEALLERRGVLPDLDATFSFVWEPWDVHSEDAKRARESYERLRSRDESEGRPVRPKGTPDPKQRRRRLLADFERGNRDAYWKLLLWLPVNQFGWADAGENYRDIKELAGWQEESEEFRARTVDASERYLAEGHDQPEIWVGKRVVFRPDRAAYRAVRLLRAEGKDPNVETYRKWSVALAAFPAFAADKEHDRIVKKAVRTDPERAELAIVTCLDAEAKADGHVSLGGYLRRRLSDTIGDRILDLVNGWPFEARLRVLEEAMRAGSAKALALAADEFLAEEDLAQSVALACDLALHGGSKEWDSIKARIEDDEAFGQRLLTELSDKRVLWKERDMERLSVPLREWLFGWVEERYHTAEDDHPVGVYSPGTRHHIQSFRGALLTSLWNQGSPESVVAVERVKERFPSLSNIDSVLLHARLRALEEGWTWVAPSELRALLRSPRKNLVRNDADLQEAVVQSLDALHDHLRRTGMSWSLWNEGPSPRPKPEERFSDFVAEWLRGDLARIAVLPNREVQPRRGERWDILVEVCSPEPANTVYAAVIVEAKLATNEKELWTGMEKQLVGRYMTNSGLRHGVYLVGYTYGPKAPEQKRRGIKPYGLTEWTAYWNKEALRLSTPKHRLRSVVIDISLP